MHVFIIFQNRWLSESAATSTLQESDELVEVLCFSCRRAKDNTVQKSMVAFLKKAGRCWKFCRERLHNLCRVFFKI